MGKIFKNSIIFLLLVCMLFFSGKAVFAADTTSFSNYLNNIKTEATYDAEKRKCSESCDSGYFQLMFGLPFSGMSRCACVPIKDGPGIMIAAILKFILASIGTLTVILFIVAGFMWSFAAGNEGSIKKAKEMIKNASIGVVVAVFSGSILAIINPNLVNIGTFSVGKIDYYCVDDNVVKSFTDSNGKAWSKNCNTVCYLDSNNSSYACCGTKVCGKMCCASGKCNEDNTACFGYIQKTTNSIGVSNMQTTDTFFHGTGKTCECADRYTAGGVTKDFSCVDKSGICGSNEYCGCKVMDNITGSYSAQSCKTGYQCATKKAIGESCLIGGSFECDSGICNNGECYPKCNYATIGKKCVNNLSDTIISNSQGVGDYVCEKGSDNIFKCYPSICKNEGDGCHIGGNGLKCTKYKCVR